MLRGRCSCAISERLTPSPTSQNPLSPIIPVHPKNPPVSPIIPVHTQKQGGGGCFFELSTGHPIRDAHPERARRGGRAEGSLPSRSSNMINPSISEFSPTLLSRLSRQIFRRHALLCALRALCGESSFFSVLSSPTCRISAKNAKSSNIPHWLSITIVNIVGAPTYCKSITTGPSPLRRDHRAVCIPTNVKEDHPNVRATKPATVPSAATVAYAAAAIFQEMVLPTTERENTLMMPRVQRIVTT